LREGHVSHADSLAKFFALLEVRVRVWVRARVRVRVRVRVR